MFVKNYVDFFMLVDIGKREVFSGWECVDVNFLVVFLFCNVI